MRSTTKPSASCGATVRPMGDLAGRLLVVEGIDGAGKSTVAAALCDALADAGEDAVLLSRATAPSLARGYAADHLSSLATLIWGYPPEARTSELGFAHWSRLLGAWFAAVDEVCVAPAVARGNVVVADGWCYKFVARFALNHGLAAAAAAFAEPSVPTQVVLLDIGPAAAAARRPRPKATEAGEWTTGPDGQPVGFVTYQTQVSAVLDTLARDRGWRTIDASPPVDLVTSAVLAACRATAATSAR